MPAARAHHYGGPLGSIAAEVVAREPVRNVHPEYARAPAAGAGRLLPVRYFVEISAFAKLRPITTARARVVSETDATMKSWRVKAVSRCAGSISPAGRISYANSEIDPERKREYHRRTETAKQRPQSRSRNSCRTWLTASERSGGWGFIAHWKPAHRSGWCWVSPRPLSR